MKNYKKIIVNFYVIINIIIFSFLIFIINNYNMTIEVKIKILSIYGTINFIISLLFYIYYFKKIINTFFIFYIATYMFNAGNMFLDAFNINKTNSFIYKTCTNEEILIAYIYVLIGLNALYFSTIIFNYNYKESIKKNIKNESFKALLIVGIIFYCISIIPTMNELLNLIKLSLQGGYFAQYQQEKVIGINGISQILANYFLVANLFILLGSKGNKKIILFTDLNIYICCLIKIMIGNRSAMMTLLIPYIFLKNLWVKKINIKKYILIFLMLIFFIFPIVSITRGITSDRSDAIINLIKDTQRESMVVESIREMGTSIVTVAYTYRLVPNVYEYKLGSTYFYSLLSIIPNLFWDIHPSVKVGTPSNWLIWNIDPNRAAVGGGLGFSTIAEAYLNFGVIGIIGISFFIGILLNLLDKYSNKNIIIALMTSIYFSYLILIVRNDSMYIFRPLIWYCLIPYMIYWVIKNIRFDKVLNYKIIK